MTELKFNVNDTVIYKTCDKVWRAGTIVRIDKDYVKINCEKHGKLFQNKEQETFVTIFDDAEKENLRFTINQIKGMIPFTEYNKFIIGTTNKTYEQKFNKWIENNNVKIGDYVEIIKAEEFVINRCHDPRLAKSIINNSLIVNKIYTITDITPLGVSVTLFGGMVLENIPYVILRKLNPNIRSDQKRMEKLMGDGVGSKTLTGPINNKPASIYRRDFYNWIKDNKVKKHTKIKLIPGVTSIHPSIDELCNEYAENIIKKGNYINCNSGDVITINYSKLYILAMFDDINPACKDKHYFIRIPYEWTEVIPEKDKIEVQIKVTINDCIHITNNKTMYLDINKNCIEDVIKFTEIKESLNDGKEHILNISNNIIVNISNIYKFKEPILICNEDRKWELAAFSEYPGNDTDHGVFFIGTTGVAYSKYHCRYQGNENLLGKTCDKWGD